MPQFKLPPRIYVSDFDDILPDILDFSFRGHYPIVAFPKLVIAKLEEYLVYRLDSLYPENFLAAAAIYAVYKELALNTGGPITSSDPLFDSNWRQINGIQNILVDYLIQHEPLFLNYDKAMLGFHLQGFSRIHNSTPLGPRMWAMFTRK